MPKTKKVHDVWSRPQTNTEVKSRSTINVFFKKKKKKKKRFHALHSGEVEISANTIYNSIIQAREAAELHARQTPRKKKMSLWEGKGVVEKRDALQAVLKGTSEELRPKASKVEDAKNHLDRAYA